MLHAHSNQYAPGILIFTKHVNYTCMLCIHFDTEKQCLTLFDVENEHQNRMFLIVFSIKRVVLRAF